ncbi:serine hydrolase domain-containing protein [Litorimonas taeanensis]|uniref:serine hydrolase domain-containing protein n=1 Tax=Litorimonas taeanensis TaxID=568099 RepID=UPI0011C42B25|nr:serine hydrolase domain-containing protein [Litorimonas taeanensis]
MKHTRHFLLGAILYFSVPSLSLAPVAAAQNTKTSEQTASPRVDKIQIDKRAKDLMRSLKMTGLAISIVEDGKISFAQGYGETVKGSGQKVTEDTVFRWASVSKGMAAHILVSMAADDKISLDAPVEDFAASLTLPPDDVEVSVSHLLAHQVGIVRNAYDGHIEDGRSAKETRKKLGDLKYSCAPATCHTYQNVAYDSASEIIETLTGLPYKSVAQTDVFDKFGMATASVSRQGLLQSKSWARPHNKRGKRIKTVKPTYYRVPASAGVNSSVVDLAKWMIGQMPDGNNANLSKEEAVQQVLQTPRVSTPREQRYMNRRFGGLKNAHYGMGFRVYDYYGHKVVGHRGGVEGYRALILFDPEERSGIAMMWNSPHHQPIGLQLEFLDQLYGRPKKDWMRLKNR